MPMLSTSPSTRRLRLLTFHFCGLLNEEMFYPAKEIRGLAERFRVHDNTVRPHSSFGYRPSETAGQRVWVVKKWKPLRASQ